MAGEFKLRRGLKNIYAAQITADDNSTGYVTGTPFHLIPAGEMTRTPSSDSANTWFDDVVFATVGTEGATEITISGASLRADAVARLLGKDVDPTTGAVLDSGEYSETYWALGGEAEGLDGTSEFFWFLKGTFTAPEESDRTKDDGTDANGMELTFNAIQTTHTFTNTGKVCKRVVIDTATSAVKSGQSWTAQVVTPDNVSTVATIATPATAISVTPTSATPTVGQTVTATATITPTGATSPVVWTTSNAAVATVSGSGNTGTIQAVAAGSAIITVTAGGVAATITLTVSEE